MGLLADGTIMARTKKRRRIGLVGKDTALVFILVPRKLHTPV